jgi:hypothetical protein
MNTYLIFTADVDSIEQYINNSIFLLDMVSWITVSS